NDKSRSPHFKPPVRVVSGGSSSREDHSIFAYERRSLDEKLIVLCNFNKKDRFIEDELLIREVEDAQLIIQNYPDIDKMDRLRPFESRVFYKV
ncbi:alpha amylase C-terminal domain-containing protein, partial [Mesobacillus subterraneus]